MVAANIYRVLTLPGARCSKCPPRGDSCNACKWLCAVPGTEHVSSHVCVCGYDRLPFHPRFALQPHLTLGVPHAELAGDDAL